ncbi:MAG TPA: 4Fe-4S binding protein [Firmicutes bacterium]|nr:4Fe-4S binding protein [Bacillota bacterium]
MAHVIGDECTKCGSCADACPFQAISEGEDKYQINPDVCTDCGLCADQCPSGAISEG